MRILTLHSQKAFTLIELLVTIGIFTFMTALVLARYSSYNSGTLLTNLAYDVALTIRQAQTYGLSVVTTGGSNFNSAYGVHFSTANPTVFTLFADGTSVVTPDGKYSLSSGDTDVSIYNIKRGAKIVAICIGSGSQCEDPNIQVLDVTFRRPEPNAIIMASPDGNVYAEYDYAEVYVADAGQTSLRTIRVNRMGQISVED